MRCCDEAAMHEQNCFVTLTYDNEHLPEDNSLHKKHFQDFMKRLRKKYVEPDPMARGPGQVATIRYFHCGEYGEETGRPHYHALLFGWRPSDLVPLRTRGKTQLFGSADLMQVWGHGLCSVGNVEFESAAYVAKYCLKKDNRKDAQFEILDADSGEVFEVQPPYATMSRRPGLGEPWYQKYKKDCYPSDFVVHRGKKMRPANYYDVLFERESPEAFSNVKDVRKEKAKEIETTSLHYYHADKTKTSNDKRTKRGDL